MHEVFLKLGWFFKVHWKRYTFAVLGIITAGALGLIPPKLLGYVIDHINYTTMTTKILLTVVIIYFANIILFLIYGILHCLVGLSHWKK